MDRTTRPNTGRTTYHRDGTVTVWDCAKQSWVRGNDPTDVLLASLGSDRERVQRHTSR